MAIFRDSRIAENALDGPAPKVMLAETRHDNKNMIQIAVLQPLEVNQTHCDTAGQNEARLHGIAQSRAMRIWLSIFVNRTWISFDKAGNCHR